MIKNKAPLTTKIQNPILNKSYLPQIIQDAKGTKESQNLTSEEFLKNYEIPVWVQKARFAIWKQASLNILSGERRFSLKQIADLGISSQRIAEEIAINPHTADFFRLPTTDGMKELDYILQTAIERLSEVISLPITDKEGNPIQTRLNTLFRVLGLYKNKGININLNLGEKKEEELDKMRNDALDIESFDPDILETKAEEDTFL